MLLHSDGGPSHDLLQRRGLAPAGIERLERMGVVSRSPIQTLLTAASMVACINAIVGGVAVAMAVHVLNATVTVAVVIGITATLVSVAVFLVHQIRRFQRAAAVVPELYDGESPGMPGWADSAGSTTG